MRTSRKAHYTNLWNKRDHGSIRVDDNFFLASLKFGAKPKPSLFVLEGLLIERHFCDHFGRQLEYPAKIFSCLFYKIQTPSMP